MNYIEEIFSRVDIQQISDFILYGSESAPDKRPYIDRIKTAQREMTEELRKRWPDEYEEIIDIAVRYAAEIEGVYTEIGLRAGLILAGQIRFR
ncbi:MAG: hypothetical protein E7638_04000 [Ruminococcaceae bacterium]|nr:hypothetical protein [Oscillospiraceae bacterium]